MGLKWTYRRLCITKWLISIFLQTTEVRCANNAQIYTDLFLEGLCIFTSYDVISYLRLAANCVHTTTAVADFTVTKKQSFWKISETAGASNFKIYLNIALNSLYISTRNDVIISFRWVENRINVFILGYVRVAIS